jgi:2-methylcitrate dehydratase PrpD
MADPVITALAQGIELEHDPALDKLYPARFAAWIAVEREGSWERVEVLDPLGSAARPVGARGVLDKFRGINPHLPADEIAGVALDIEHHSVSELLALLAATRTRQRKTA